MSKGDTIVTVSDSDVAIIGMACRFPGADSVDRFWDVLRDGQETLTLYSDEELQAAGVPADRLADPHYVKAAQTIPGVDLFDAGLFQFTHDEAEILDPQHRVFLECALEALERAGHDPERSHEHIGVYAGAGMNTYLPDNLGDRYRAGSSVDRYRLMLANDKDFLATRVSYKLNLRGPSVSINTACSTSLVAVHTACLGLLGGECDMALAGAVHLSLHDKGYEYQEGMIFSPDGHCRAFDAQARGTVIGSGSGVVILKRLADALADGDWIHAVIKGTAINNDGANKTGYTAPSIDGQAGVIADAQNAAGVAPETVSYVEAHGTGTPLGDPIEVAALTNAFRQETDAVGFCALGSVKTNVGHLDTAAGMAGLTKVALMMEHGSLVPSLHFESPNPEIDFNASPFFVNTRTTEWRAHDGPLRAGVSSFGIGGTNAHAVLEQAPERPTPVRTRDSELLVLSARSGEALKQTAADLARYLRQHSDLDLAAVATTLGLGRRAYGHRLALVATSTREAAMALALGDTEQIIQGAAGAQPTQPIFVLSAGEVDPDGAEALRRSVPAYREAVERCAEALGQANDDPGLRDAGATVAGFVHEYATAMTLASWGLEPAGLAADTPAGLAVAAALTESLSLEDALAWVRGTAPAQLDVPRWPVFSTRTGNWMSEEESRSAGNWTADGDLPALDTLTAGDTGRPVRLTAGETPVRGLHALLALVGELWAHGAPVDFAKVQEGAELRRVPLPPRPFERRRHWIEPHETSSPETATNTERLAARLDPQDGRYNATLLTDYLVEEVARLLGDDQQAGVDTNLFELGLDSLMLVEVTAKLGKELDFEVPATAFVEYPTIRAFVDNLTELMGYGPPTEGATPASDGRLSRRAQRAAARADGNA